QPLYLAATEQGALPELRRVVVAYGNQIAMEPTLEASLARIFGGRGRPEEAAGRPPERGQTPPPVTAAITAAVQQAWEAWQRGEEGQGGADAREDDVGGPGRERSGQQVRLGEGQGYRVRVHDPVAHRDHDGH